MLHRLRDFFSADLAIDLGTTNTVIGLAGEGIVLSEPSVVAVAEAPQRGSHSGCAVGHLARQMEGRTPESISVVRPLRDGVVTDFDLCEAMLGYFLRKAQRHAWRARPRVLVTAPSAMTPVERRALYNSVYRAGAGQVQLISRAKAAALGAGLPLAEPLASMVCAIGGGTTEVAVISLGEVVAASSVRVGGDAMDQVLVDDLRRRMGLKIGLPAAEQLRVEIGSASPLDERLAEVRGLDAVTGLPRKAQVTSADLRAALAEPLERIVQAIQQTLDGCGPDLAGDLFDSGLVLCGGGALLPGLPQFIKDRTGLPARVAVDSLSVTAHGTLACLEHLPQWRGLLESGDDDL
jgi:rod shape-determining protein MreB